ncbi:MAG: aminotransferase class IV [Weeksellaceae bacterium]
MIPIVNFNGDLIEKSSPVFSFDHAAILNGEILQEPIRLLNGSLLYAEKHYFHLMAMMRMARMDIPMSFTPGFFYDEMNKLAVAEGLENAKMTFNVSANHTDTDYWITATVASNQLISKLPYEIDQYRETHVANGAHERVIFLNPKSRILTTYAFENHLQDLILLNENKAIARGIHGNMMVLKDNILYVPQVSDGAIDNVSRDMTIEAAKRVPDIEEIKEESIFPFALMKADEVFVVNDGDGFYPVNQFRKKSYSSEILPSIVDYFEERG